MADLVLIIVFDGLRPDQVTAENCPNLYGLARRGVEFINHHATFPTLTRVNVASLFTGCHPGRHGITTNYMYLPDVDPTWHINTGNHAALRELDRATDGRVVMAPTLGETVHGAGMAMSAIGVGSTGNTFLHHPRAGALGGVVVHPAMTVPESEAARLDRRFGAWPESETPGEARRERAVTVLLEHVLPTYRPAVATLWMSDPDSAQHDTSVGSAVAMESIRLADAQLGRIIEHLDRTGMSGATDVMVASDHGHSTVIGEVDMAGYLVEAGVKDASSSLDVLVAANGGCDAIYVRDHDAGKVRAAAEALMLQPWCGPIFVRDGPAPIPGTLPLSLIGCLNQRSPDILMSFAWGDGRNGDGVQGTCYGSAIGSTGRGQHGSLSPYEVHGVLIAAGPHFKEGAVVGTPSGNVDITPTVLHALGLAQPEGIDGRVLNEALRGGPHPDEVRVTSELHDTSTTVSGTTYRQEVRLSRAGPTVYVGHGRADRS